MRVHTVFLVLSEELPLEKAFALPDKASLAREKLPKFLYEQILNICYP